MAKADCHQTVAEGGQPTVGPARLDRDRHQAAPGEDRDADAAPQPRHDAQDQLLRENELKQAIRDFTRFSTEQQLAANRSWNEMTYRPKMAAYDTALSRM